MAVFGEPETWGMKVGEFAEESIRQKEIRDFLLSDIKNFQKQKQFPNQKYELNFNQLVNKLKQATGKGTDYNTLSKAYESLNPNIKNQVIKLGTGQSGTSGLTQAEKDLFSKNYKTKNISQMATEITGLPYDNKITKAKNAQLYRYYLTQSKLGNISKEDIARGARLKGTTPKDLTGFSSYRKAQQNLMELDPNIYEGLTPAQLDSRLKKSLQFSTVRGAFDVPPSLAPSFEHFQGITPGTIVQDPNALRKVGITTKDFNFNVLGAKAKNNIYKTIKNELRTAKAASKIGNTELAKESLNKVNEIYDDIAKKLKTVNRDQLPKYNLSKNTLKEVNLKAIDLDVSKNLGKTIEQYVRFVSAGPAKEIAKIEQPNLVKAIELFQEGKDKAAKKLIQSRLPSVKQGQLFSFPGVLFEPSAFREAIEGGKLIAKMGAKGAGLLFQGAFTTPLGATALIAGTGEDFDPKEVTNRLAIETQAAFAKDLIKGSENITKNIKNPLIKKAAQGILNLPFGITPAMAARVARVASPLGVLSLAGEAGYDIYKQQEELKKLKETDPQAYESFMKTRVSEPMSEEQYSDIQDMGREGAMSGGVMRKGYANGPEDPTKRKFMKVGLGILGALPFGIGKVLQKPAVKEAITKAAPAAEAGWSWVKDNFWTVVNTVNKKAKKFTKLKDGEVKIHKDVEVIDNPETIRVRYKTDNGNTAETVYTKPYKEVNPETGEIIDVPGDFQEYQDVYRLGDGEVYKDFEEEIIDSIEGVKNVFKKD